MYNSRDEQDKDRHSIINLSKINIIIGGGYVLCVLFSGLKTRNFWFIGIKIKMGHFSVIPIRTFIHKQPKLKENRI